MKQTLFLLLMTIILLSCKKEEEIPMEIKACFSFNYNGVINDGEIQFLNCSENATNFLWDFGDGQTSTEKEPLHLFESINGVFPYFVTLIAYNGNETDTIKRSIFDDIHTEKPNIYIYPDSQLNLCLKINFPIGGNIVKSIPEYGDGWCFNVDKNGIIDNQYTYLFYESIQPDIYQYEKGWCIKKDSLSSFFKQNMKMYNFSNAEIQDFIDYWIPLLNKADYYKIYPQTNKIIDNIIQLDFSEKPDNVYRLFYGIVETDKYYELEKPTILAFNRNGFYVVEWGVFRK
ncbi:MAG: PKD domain-containing protein [Draconibacterium sp.]